jgi:chromate transporter
VTDSPLVQLALDFGLLSFIAVGGGMAVLPEMQRIVVDNHGWMTAATFADLFALAQAAPGPNVLVVSLLGWQVAGLAGAAVATVAMTVPTSVLTYAFARVWERSRDARWRKAIQRGLAPVTVGLMLAAAYLITRAADETAAAYAFTAFTAAVVIATKLHPLWLIALGAVLGLLGVV